MVTHKQSYQPQHHLFRQEALEKSTSPEKLDQLVQIVSPQRWLSLAALGILVVTGCGWGIWGRIPITVTGRGMLVYPSKVVAVQANSTGRIQSLMVQEGDRVEQGQVLATIDQTELQNQLKLAREKLAQLQLQDQMARAAQNQREKLNQTTIAQQQEALQQELRTIQSLTPLLREKGVESIQREREALQQRLQNLQAVIPVYQQRWQARQEAQAQGALSKDAVFQAQQEYLNAQAQFNEVEAQLKQLDVKEADAQQQYLSNLNRTNELEAQIKALATRAATQVEQDIATTGARSKEMQETANTIAQLELQLKRDSQIVSSRTGELIELAVQPGQRLEPGTAIGSIAPCASAETLPCEASDTDLVGVVFLPVSEGKKVRQGMKVQITPSSVKREEFGGIVGRVERVSEFPVTQQGAANLAGLPEVLPEVMQQGAYLAVFVKLERDTTASGYRWSSSTGPQQAITQGITASARIRVEERAPISYVLPILKSWTGLE